MITQRYVDATILASERKKKHQEETVGEKKCLSKVKSRLLDKNFVECWSIISISDTIFTTNKFGLPFCNGKSVLFAKISQPTMYFDRLNHIRFIEQYVRVV